ncbi:MAG: DNA polymerase ligase N-terminal domain-containing protein [Bdellovibrio sp.]
MPTTTRTVRNKKNGKGLKEYVKKRNFKKTPEPTGAEISKKGKTSAKSTPLMFVVQEHHASRLHYDFRLELNGVLKSWAVPKGPSTDPSIKRLAVEVEDHPLSYGSFEGTIPEHEYGAGQVYIWDTGTWQPKGDPEAGLKKGHLEFSLKGKKLRGDWILIKTHLPAGNKSQWLLIKRTDSFASTAEIIKTPKRISVNSKKKTAPKKSRPSSLRS